ncbi:hypothetical protein CPC08DRAFT_752990 [Agrocybe pediades]|nr:hypothetical protein CPC08DRAFT_752990 [Agrocybe pediades]
MYIQSHEGEAFIPHFEDNRQRSVTKFTQFFLLGLKQRVPRSSLLETLTLPRIELQKPQDSRSGPRSQFGSVWQEFTNPMGHFKLRGNTNQSILPSIESFLFSFLPSQCLRSYVSLRGAPSASRRIETPLGRPVDSTPLAHCLVPDSGGLSSQRAPPLTDSNQPTPRSSSPIIDSKYGYQS